MKTKHDHNCHIYSSLTNGGFEDGVCTCGYGLQYFRNGDPDKMYSEELWEEYLSGRIERVWKQKNHENE